MNNCCYAQLKAIDGNQVVIGISSLASEVEAPHLIPLQSMTDCQLGDHYINGGFVTPPPSAEPVE